MSGLRNYFTANLTTKALALVLAILVWYFVDLDVSSTERRDRVEIELEFAQRDVVPLRITGPDGKEISTVRVDLSGPRGDLRDVPVRLKCHHIVAGSVQSTLLVTLDVADLHLPPRLSATITPDVITVSVDRLVEAYLPVKADPKDCLIGRRVPGLTYDIQSVNPPRVSARVPASLLGKYQSEKLPILPLDITDLKESTQFRAAFPEDVQRKVQIAPNQEVTVVVRVQPEPDSYLVEVPVAYQVPQGSPFEFDVKKPQTVQVRLGGPKTLIDRIRQGPLPITIYIDIVGYKVTEQDVGGTIQPPIRYSFSNPEYYQTLSVQGLEATDVQVKVKKKQ